MVTKLTRFMNKLENDLSTDRKSLNRFYKFDVILIFYGTIADIETGMWRLIREY